MNYSFILYIKQRNGKYQQVSQAEQNRRVRTKMLVVNSTLRVGNQDQLSLILINNLIFGRLRSPTYYMCLLVTQLR